MNKKNHRAFSTSYISGLLALLMAGTQALYAQSTTPKPSIYDFKRLKILGTSLDARIVATNKADADLAFETIHSEIMHLKTILNSRETHTDLWKVNHATKPVEVSLELIELLTAYDNWSYRTKKAFSGQTAELAKLWRQAEKSGRTPDPETLRVAAEAAQTISWKLNTNVRTVTRADSRQIDVDALGKSFIIDRAVKAAQAKVPGLKGILLDVGGDIIAWGDGAAKAGSPWRIYVADPLHPAENAAPLAALNLRNLAVVTSGSYEKFYTVKGKKYSHIFDPRTGQPADQLNSVTVIAKDALTANALSTTLSVLGPEEGLALIKTIEHAECLMITPDGRQIRSEGFARFEQQWPVTDGGQPTLWPAGHEVTVEFTVKSHPTNVSLFPYVAVWVEGSDGRIINTVELWAHPKKLRYLRDLDAWWKFGRRIKPLAQAVTRATRPAGQYSIVWNGLDDQGNPLPPGDYRICLEVSYEDGDDKTEKVWISCKEKETRIVMTETSTFTDAHVVYGQTGK